MDGPIVLSPVDVELDIEVGKRSKLLNMVVGDVMEIVRQAKLAIKKEIVQVKKCRFAKISREYGSISPTSFFHSWICTVNCKGT